MTYVVPAEFNPKPYLKLVAPANITRFKCRSQM